MTAELDTPAVGARIAPHLTLQRELGRGGIATVFEAYHERLGATVAVKIVTLQGPRAHEAALRLIREARMCARLDDPHVPRVYDVSTLPDGRPYVVMEQVSGATLESWLLEGPLPVDAVVSIAHELLSALIAVHGAGIVHRDVKPSNVILQWAHGSVRWVRLLDFGIAYAPGERLSKSEWDALRADGILGTPGYMPPEQLNADSVDVRGDLYSLGIVLYELLTGRLPFEAEEDFALLRETCNRDVPDVREGRPDCPQWLAWVLSRATERDPDSRFANADEMLEALHGWGMAATPPPRRLPSVGAPRRSRAGRWAALGATAVLAGGLWLVADQARSPMEERTSEAPSGPEIAPAPPLSEDNVVPRSGALSPQSPEPSSEARGEQAEAAPSRAERRREAAREERRTRARELQEKASPAEQETAPASEPQRAPSRTRPIPDNPFPVDPDQPDVPPNPFGR